MNRNYPEIPKDAKPIEVITDGNGWKREIFKKIKRGPYVIHHERISDHGLGDDKPLAMRSAWTPGGEYLGDPKTANVLWKKGITQFEKSKPDHSVCSIGFNPDTKTWYGWSHRAIFGFRKGSKGKKGKGWTASSNPKQAAKRFAQSVS